ncbi:triose-phosphate isomerase [Alteromonas aestuariivivens]|uniref:Triosephosphate isomerase n=1 Tax=Alteromonas aestuariivivens TaxID=1938339 RepID=A0A3D8M8Y5_9ALTE|nr:triose-phosphate isomerase [Alteromonas aestuariivivens]RDV26113.1 triose-phosphate isomerase [Alteromonas aestuariivivens]
MNKELRKPLVAGNWKMNGNRSLVQDFCKSLAGSEQVDIVVCPPCGYLSYFDQASFALGAQDVSHLNNGAHTGDHSVEMIKELGCRYVIVGHSERREDHQESSELVAEKALAVLTGGLTPIVCVGEPLDIREDNKEQEFIGKQLTALFDKIPAELLSQCVIAYEPIWAIGTGKTASPEQAQEVHKFIRDELAKVGSSVAEKVRILYGGSVKPSNASELFNQPDVDGGLIGGASLTTEDFTAICQSAN